MDWQIAYTLAVVMVALTAMVRQIAAPDLILMAALLGACGEREPSAPPAPGKLTREAIGYYCSMIVVDHIGPKGQILLQGRPDPVWFTSVRDTLAFTLLPDEPRDIAAIYVNDMGRATWDEPEPDIWINAKRAWYVVGSDKRGGMGAPEAVPFLDKMQAEHFADQNGGAVVNFANIPQDYILGWDQNTPDGMSAHTLPMEPASRTSPRSTLPSN